jgi:transcriptional regulator with XRE-family HTH domain
LWYDSLVIQSPIHERLVTVAGERTNRRLAELTKTNPETVRRYMQGSAPSVEFLSAVCKSLAISGDWLLTGRGPMKLDEVKTESLRQADPSELLSAMAGNIERLCERVDRIERYMQTMEIRLRARRNGDGQQADKPGEDDSPRVRKVKSVADAIAKRSRPDDH